MFRKKLQGRRAGRHEIELEVADTSNPMPMFEIPGQPGMANMGMMNLGDMLRQGLWRAHRAAQDDRRRKLRGSDRPKRQTSFWTTRPSPQTRWKSVEQNGIVFLDEIDKVCARPDVRGGDVSAAKACSAICCR